MNIERRLRSQPVLWCVVSLMLLVFTAGCATHLGPDAITRDRFDYTAALAETEKEQLLRNIVRLRYLDAPVFVRVDSIISQYSVEGTLSLGADINGGLTGDDVARVGASGRWFDRPTITYAPITGRAFARNLLTPVQPAAVLALVQAGWSGDVLFRLAVRSINGLANESTAQVAYRHGEAGFSELLGLWTHLQQRQQLGLRRKVTEAGDMYFGYVQPSSEDTTELMRFRELLDLPEDTMEFKISYGLLADEALEMSVLTASILEIMADLAGRIEVPAVHVEQGRTWAQPPVSEYFTTRLFEVRAALERPVDAYVAVYERGHWFYISDGDAVTKRTFAILQVLLSLTESSGDTKSPVVTVGN